MAPSSMTSPGGEFALQHDRDLVGPVLANGRDRLAQGFRVELGSEPPAGRKGPPNPDLIPANNPVLRPPVAGKIGLWSKTDSSSYFKDYVVSPK